MDTERIVRPAVEADLPAILDIYNEVIANSTAVYDYEPHSLAMRREWMAAKKASGFPVRVAMEAGDLAGFGSFGPFRSWAAYRYSVEHSVYVAAGYRGRGIGKRLLVQLIADAADMKMHTMIAGIDAENEASIRMHRALGFEQTAHMRQVGWKFNRWLDLVFMQKMLGPAQAGSG